jgi:hypothetical protein
MRLTTRELLRAPWLYIFLGLFFWDQYILFSEYFELVAWVETGENRPEYLLPRPDHCKTDLLIVRWIFALNLMVRYFFGIICLNLLYRNQTILPSILQILVILGGHLVVDWVFDCQIVQ